MRISGLQKLTLLDYPGLLACTVFLPGCNLRCPFCHNADLVLPERMEAPQLTVEYLLEFLQSRKGKLDGVCITGGEPTLQKDLPRLLETVKAMGFRVKLDTNGTNPQVLRQLLEAKLPDYVAMDIKNSPDRYTQTCGGVEVLEPVRESAALLMEGAVDYEFRTTVCNPLHTPEELAAIGQWLRGAKQYFLQQFVASSNLVGSGLTAPTKEEMEAMRQAVLPYIPNTRLRGVS
jgi:pyruvate formate lyase activating enzyme